MPNVLTINGGSSSIRFAVVNGMSANTGMRWDLSETKRLLGYEPLDNVAVQA